MFIPRSLRNLPLVVELFALGNLAFLGVDIYVAHSINAFRHQAEWIPIVFSVLAVFVLGLDLARSLRRSDDWTPGRLGLPVGAVAIVVGVGGLLFHLDSQFFSNVSIRSLVYTAPLAAPLSYTGLGFLLLLNRMVERRSLEWGRWVVFLVFGGFVGIFALALLDHARNGFFHTTEWIPVFASAYGMAFLVVVMVKPANQRLLKMTLLVLAVGALVGFVGLFFHVTADLVGPSGSRWDNFLYGAPVFAPLLLPNLAILGSIGIVDLGNKTRGPVNSR